LVEHGISKEEISRPCPIGEHSWVPEESLLDYRSREKEGRVVLPKANFTWQQSLERKSMGNLAFLGKELASMKAIKENK